MSMTREEAIAALKESKRQNEIMRDNPSTFWASHQMAEGVKNAKRRIEAFEVALSALRHQIWEDQLWHNAKTDPPKTPGLYYGKKDATNSMYACQYRDGVWVLDMYPQQKMDIVQWADHTAFVRQDEDTALRPVSREQVEKVFPGCEKCHNQANWPSWIEKGFVYCPKCGTPLTSWAWEKQIKRLEALKDA